MSTTALILAAALDPSPSPAPIPILPTSSPAAELITVTLAGLAAVLTAVAGIVGVRRRRNGPDAADSEDNPARLRERITAAEARLDAYRELDLPRRVTVVETRLDEALRRLEDLEERVTLSRAVDVALEAEHAPARRRRKPTT